MNTTIFSKIIFGVELAERLDAVFAMDQKAVCADHVGSSFLFAAPSGISFNEADVLTLKYHLLQPDDLALKQLRVDLNTRWLHCLAAASLDHSEETAQCQAHQFRSYY
jgi:hypothetical protein